MTFLRHSGISVEGVLAIPLSDFERQFEGVVRDDNGRLMTPAEVRRHFEEAKAQGHRILPMNGKCEGWDYHTGCPGHPMEPEKLRYLKIALHGGGSYVQPLSQVHQAIDGELDGLQVGDKITLDFELIEMTEDEYENLAEFAGH